MSNIESIFVEVFFPKSKPILVGLLYWSPNKHRFIKYLQNPLKENNISNIQECYLIGDFNVNLLSGNKMLLHKQYHDSYSQAPPLVKKIYMKLCFPRSLHQLIAELTKTTERTKTLTNHILTNSAEKVIQSSIIEMVLSDHGFIYCTRKIGDKKIFR